MDIVCMNDLKEQVRLANPIEEVINEKVKLDRNHKGLCPFHAEKTPSFSVNIKGQYFNCFGCGKAGDVFDFVSLTQNLSFFDSLKYLAGRRGIQFPKEVDFAKEEGQRSIETALNEASTLYHLNLPVNVKEYLNGRGISDEIIEAYKIGYCAGDTQHKASKEILLQAGLTYENGQEYFKGYITFPNIIYGRVVYISGRCFGEKKHKKLQAEKVPLNHVYNEPALKEKDVIIAEGEIDTLTLLSNGFNACGILGSQSFRPEWKEKFNSCENTYLSFDADEAGEAGNEKIAEILGAKAKIIALPETKDVNDYFKENTKDDYTKLIDGALSLIEYRIKKIPAEISPLKLPQILEPFIKEIAGLSIPQGNAILQHFIKKHFNMTDKDIQGYEKQLKSYRKETDTEKDGKIKTKQELMNILQNEDSSIVIHPAQDYRKGTMYFTAKIQEVPYLITSSKELVSYEDSALKGINLKTDSIDTARLSYKGLSAFLKSEREIDIYELYQRIYGYIGRFILFPEASYLSLITLWIMGTYVFMIFRYFPYIWLNAEKGSGKTLLMEILAKIAFNGDLIINPTEAVIFRDVSNNLITMFIDEVEQLRKRDKDIYSSLISLLNAGFNKSNKVKRTEGTGKGTFIVKAYDAYSPKMFAGINEIDDVLQDRTIRIPLLRKKNTEKVQRYKESQETIELQTQIRDDLYIFALSFAKDIAELYQKDGEQGIEGLAHLSNRELDIWEPMMLLANIVDASSNGQSNITEQMEALSKKSFEEKQNESVTQNETYKLLTVAKAMLDDLPALSEENGVFVYKAGEVLEYFKKCDEFEWIEKSNTLTKRLKRIGVKSEQKRIDNEKQRIYSISKSKIYDLCERFSIK